MSYGIGGAGSVPEAGTFVNPVAGTKILLRRSDTQGKKPAAGDAEYGELFVNYHSGSPMLCFKDNANTIVEIRPLTEVELALGELTDVDTTGATNGMVLSYNGSTWVPVSAASIAIDVDLGYIPAADKGTVTNTAGDDAEIPLANGTSAGLSLNDFGDAEKLKLFGIEDGAEVNIGTDLGYTPAAGNGTVTSSTGDDATIPLANGTNAGLSLHNYSQADKDKLDAYPDDPTDGLVDLGYTAAADKGTVTNTAGADAEIPLATDALAGLIVDAPSDGEQYARKDGAWDVVEAVTPDLQSVTDNGNTTTNDINTTGDINADNVVATGDVQATSFNGGQIAFRNQIINGDLRVWQRGIEFQDPDEAQFTADRWRVLSDPTSVARQNNAPPGFTYSAVIYATGTPASGTRQTFIQPIELPATGEAGVFSNGSQWTFSFWVRLSSGGNIPINGFFRDASNNSLNQVEVFSTNVTSTGAWSRVSHTFTITSDPASTSTCFVVGIDSVTAFNNAILATGFQLEPGPVATPFEHRPIGTELALCQRYYEVVNASFWNFQDTINERSGCAINFSATKRTAPVCGNLGADVEGASPAVQLNVISEEILWPTPRGAFFKVNAGASIPNDYYVLGYSFTADAEL